MEPKNSTKKTRDKNKNLKSLIQCCDLCKPQSTFKICNIKSIACTYQSGENGSKTPIFAVTGKKTF